MNFYYVYILYSHKDQKYYAGYTGDLGNRLKEHQKGQVKSTKHRRPLEPVYYEAYRNEEDARRRERYMKSGKGKKFLRVRLRRFLECSGFGPSTGSP